MMDNPKMDYQRAPVLRIIRAPAPVLLRIAAPDRKDRRLRIASPLLQATSICNKGPAANPLQPLRRKGSSVPSPNSSRIHWAQRPADTY